MNMNFVLMMDGTRYDRMDVEALLTERNALAASVGQLQRERDWLRCELQKADAREQLKIPWDGTDMVYEPPPGWSKEDEWADIDLEAPIPERLQRGVS